MSATDSGHVANTSNFAFQVSSSRQISRTGRPAYRPTTGTIAAALMYGMTGDCSKAATRTPGHILSIAQITRGLINVVDPEDLIYESKFVGPPYLQADQRFRNIICARNFWTRVASKGLGSPNDNPLAADAIDESRLLSRRVERASWEYTANHRSILIPAMPAN
jgi:hypothetical protein